MILCNDYAICFKCLSLCLFLLELIREISLTEYGVMPDSNPKILIVFQKYYFESSVSMLLMTNPDLMISEYRSLLDDNI